ncbi:hypothetical protein C8J57DRAFT_1532340 [Mycena rebaudengoi]|nr:hypothetical protein C8J57DRAFT_1532340 [Mycena rebaudengoi]
MTPRLRNLAPLPSDVYLEISHHVDRNTLTALNRASSTTHNATRTSLYRHIEVAATAPLLVSTLANNRALSEMVCSLTFPFVTRAVTNIVGSEWNEVLVAMIHLQHLAVQQYVHMDARIVSDIRFRLLSFSAGYALSRGWDTFVRAQLHIKTLTIYGFSLLLAGDLPTTFVNLEQDVIELHDNVQDAFRVRNTHGLNSRLGLTLIAAELNSVEAALLGTVYDRRPAIINWYYEFWAQSPPISSQLNTITTMILNREIYGDVLVVMNGPADTAVPDFDSPEFCKILWYYIASGVDATEVASRRTFERMLTS